MLGICKGTRNSLSVRSCFYAFLLACSCALWPQASTAQAPIKIGFGMALTGGLAGGGKMTLLAYQIWKDEINAKGGLLGRPVELVYYDDQSNPSIVPNLYAKLLDVDKVDLVISPYATNQIAPAMPIVMQKGMAFMSLFGTGVNDDFKYNKYFQIVPNGADTKVAPSLGFLETTMLLDPKPQSIAIVGTDAEYAHNRFRNMQKHSALCTCASHACYGYALLAVANVLSFSSVESVHLDPCNPDIGAYPGSLKPPREDQRGNE